MNKSKQRRFFKKKRSFRRPFPRISIKPQDILNYKRVRLIIPFLSQQGKILSRRVTKLTLKQQRSVTISIKQARILSSIPFLNNKEFVKVKKIESDAKNAKNRRFRKKKNIR